MFQEIHPVFSVRGDLDTAALRSDIASASPWPDADISFTWTNFDYPLYHFHSHFELFILVQGTLYHNINGNTTIMNAGQACFLCPDDHHSFITCNCDQIIGLNFYITPEYMHRVTSTYSENLLQKLFLHNTLFFPISTNILNRCITDTQFLQFAENIPLADKVDHCRILFVQLLSELLLQNTVTQHYPAWLTQMLLDLSTSSFQSCSIKSELPKKYGYSYSRLSSMFKKYMGCTINQYITAQRISRAKDYLSQSNMKIIDIGVSIGCDNITHFNRIFKNSTGMTPSQYRKKYSLLPCKPEKL